MFLLDENLSRNLKSALAHIAPAAHVSDFGFERASDIEIWRFARESEYCIVSKDKDFLQHAFYYGHPPKIIWLAIGNCSTAHLRIFLRSREEGIRRFMEDNVSSALVLS